MQPVQDETDPDLPAPLPEPGQDQISVPGIRPGKRSNLCHIPKAFWRLTISRFCPGYRCIK